MDKELSKEESLEIITRMIANTKSRFSKGDSFFLLLWGWSISLTNFAHYSLEQIGYLYPYYVWFAVIPVSLITIWKARKLSKEAVVTTYVDKMHGHIWIAVSVGIVISLIFMGELNMHHNPIILDLAGIGTYITGTLVKFRPIVIGAIVLWIASCVAFTLPVVDQYLVAGIGIIFGYLIPGYMLKKTENQHELQTA